MPVGDLGPEDVATVSPETSIESVVETMSSETVGGVVVTEDEEPVGIVTDRDVALAVTETDDVASANARELMTEDPVTLPEDAEGIEISRTVEEHGVRRIPVVDESGSLSGIVTVDDLVATIGEQLDGVSDTIEAQSSEYRP